MARRKSKDFYSEIDQIADHEPFIESVRVGFDEIEDPRAQDNRTLRCTP